MEGIARCYYKRSQAWDFGLLYVCPAKSKLHVRSHVGVHGAWVYVHVHAYLARFILDIKSKLRKMFLTVCTQPI